MKCKIGANVLFCGCEIFSESFKSNLISELKTSSMKWQDYGVNVSEAEKFV